MQPSVIKHNHRFQDLSGNVYNRLTVLGWEGCKNNRTMWKCRCRCGNEIVAAAHDIKTGHTQSCGCYNAERRYATNVTHGQSFAGRITPEYRAYSLAKGRCSNTNTPNFKDYGGRGIEFRFASFEAFFAEVGKRPSDRHSLDRIDNFGHYEPGNVRWATRKEQNANRRMNHQITIQGRTLTQSDWARELGANCRDTIRDRMKRGFCAECAVFVKGKPKVCSHNADVRTNKAFA